MKAVLWRGQEIFTPGEVEKPTFGPNQILVSVKAASICTSDFHYADWNCIPPIIPGHEVAGIVAEVGAKVKKIKKGQRVVLDPVQRCGKCIACTGDISHLCMDTRHLGYSKAPGGWAELVAIDEQNAYLIPKNVNFDEAALTEPAAVCMESFNRANFRKGQSVLILGDGTFGFIHAMLARTGGASKIVVAGHYDERLSRIKKSTSAVICNTHKEDLEKTAKKIVGDAGFDIAIEATGAAKAPNMGLKLLKPRGTLIIFSYIFNPETLDLATVSMKELNVLGSCRSLNCFDKCLKLMGQGKLNISELIDIKVGLNDVEAAMDELKKDKKNIFKAVLIP
jgi:2-desacetyl-2-hydroxyethyl bacteriochlorophyllide A dehydrogenase